MLLRRGTQTLAYLIYSVSICDIRGTRTYPIGVFDLLLVPDGRGPLIWASSSNKFSTSSLFTVVKRSCLLSRPRPVSGLARFHAIHNAMLNKIVTIPSPAIVKFTNAEYFA